MPSSTRRDFLRYSSTAAAGFAIVALTDSSLFGAQTAPDAPLLSLGYASDLPATSVRLGSTSAGSAGRRMRVTIRGGARAEAYRAQQGGVAVDLVSPSGERVFFSSATRFAQPGYASVVLPSVSLSVKNLASKRESLLPIGRPGVYVVAVRESASDAAPNWSRLHLVRQGERFTIPGAPFSYAVLSVD